MFRISGILPYLYSIIFVIMFNVGLSYIYLEGLVEIGNKKFTSFEKNLKSESQKITNMIDIISSYWIEYNANNCSVTPQFFESVGKISATSGFYITNILLLDKNHNIIFQSQYYPTTYNINDSIKSVLINREYFKKASQNPNIIHMGKIIKGITSEKLAIPFCKVVKISNERLGIIVVGLSIMDYINSMDHGYFTIKPIDSEFVLPLEEKSILDRYNISMTKEINGINYLLELQFNKQFFFYLLLYFLPWNIACVAAIILLRYQLYIKSILDLTASFIKNNDLNATILLGKVKDDIRVDDVFPIISSIIYNIQLKAQVQKTSLEHLNNILLKYLADSYANMRENNVLNEEIKGLLQDKSVNLNDEYIKAIIEFKDSHQQNVLFLQELLLIISDTISAIKTPKSRIDVLSTLKCLCNQFKLTSYYSKEISLISYTVLFKNMLLFINKYFCNLCEIYSLSCNITIEDTGELLLIFEGDISLFPRNKKQTSFNHNSLLLSKIQFLATVVGFVPTFIEKQKTLVLQLRLNNTEMFYPG